MASRGRLAFTSEEELEAAIEDYFQSLRVFIDEIEEKPDGTKTTRKVELEPEPPTMAGLAHHLGVVRNTIWNYGMKDDFGHVIARAKNRLAMYSERSLFDQRKANGAKFSLEVNHGYGREADLGGQGGEFSMKVIPPASSDQIRAIPKWGDDAGDE